MARARLALLLIACGGSQSTTPSSDASTDSIAIDAPDDRPEKGTCLGKPDGTVCDPGADECHTWRCLSQACTFTCQGCKDGFQWDLGDPTARCCGGKKVNTTTEQNCGVCGLKCAPPTACAKRATDSGDHYYCVGCNGTNDLCWSACCSAQYDSCTASNCTDANCSTKCEMMYPGSRCATTGNGSDYCTY